MSIHKFDASPKYLPQQMIAVIQRVSEASVTIEQQVKGAIEQGFLILLGIATDDTDEDTQWLVKKIVN